MTEYTVFLRGINVGGNKKVPMADLKKMLTAMGYDQVRTVLNSGNVFLEAEDTSVADLENQIEENLEETFGFPVPVIVRTADRVRGLLSEAPFGNLEPAKTTKWLVTFRKEPGEKLGLKAELEGVELIYEAEDLICCRLDLTHAGTLDVMKLLESRYGKDITTRTWKTLEKLVPK